MGRHFKFPDAGDRSPNQPAVMCPAERVLALFNQHSGDKGQRISAKVKTWFTTMSLSRGWGHIWWFEDVLTNRSSGCVMSIPTTTITVPESYELTEGDNDGVPMIEPPYEE